MTSSSITNSKSNQHFKLKGVHKKTGVPCACMLTGKLPGDDDDCDCVLDTSKSSSTTETGESDEDDEESNDDDDDEEEASVHSTSPANMVSKKAEVAVKNVKQTPGKNKKASTAPAAAVSMAVQPLLNDKVTAPAAEVPPTMEAPAAVAPVASAGTGKCAEIAGRIERIRAEISLWGDHTTWNDKINSDKLVVASETTAGLADMLADIRYELHQITVPVLVEVLADKLEMLQKEHTECEHSVGKEWEKVHEGESTTSGDGESVNIKTLLVILASGAAVVFLVYWCTTRMNSLA
ncbi:unnamed protein product [Amoebophrya sp. A25]|nr:unnamed protein product [Amoebophrya sp. A25]|eukprot:GSA25T00014209001.1